MRQRNATVVIGANFGDEGKGLWIPWSPGTRMPL
jgi:adenylosuccinate synthase